MSLSNIKVGDKVIVECMTSMGGPDSTEKVTKVGQKYDENTGKPYKVIYCGEHMFSAVTGNALNPPTMYFISGKA